MARVYLDNNATTMMDPRVVEAMVPLLGEQYANPSSIHQLGQQVRHAVESAREEVAAAVGAKARQVIFTSGGTEANSLAIRGALAARPNKRHLVTTAVEHDSVLRLAQQLEGEGYRVTYVGVDHLGRLDPAEFEAALTAETALASVMHANNETGVIFPIERLGRMAADKSVPLHVDAIQTVGKLPIDVGELGVDLLSIAAHKFHGPKGVGALYIKRGTRLQPMFVGGHQERDLRAGTENVAGIVGMALALRLAVEQRVEDDARVRGLRDRLERGIVQGVAIAHGIGDVERRLASTSNIGFENLEADAILMLLSNEGVFASSGAACSSGSLDPSHVLAAMGIDQRIAHGAIRFSLSRFTTEAEVEEAIDIVRRAIGRLQTMQPREVVMAHPHPPA